MAQINAYLVFKGHCAEAMQFYQDCLGGGLVLNKIADSPMAAQWPEAVQQHILYASLNNGPLVLLGSDVSGWEVTPGNNVQISLSCDTIAELKGYFSKLAHGGRVTREPHSFFQGTIGALTDKFGFDWMFYSPGTGL